MFLTRATTATTATKNVKQAQDVNSKGTISQIKSKMPYVEVENISEKIERAHRSITRE